MTNKRNAAILATTLIVVALLLAFNAINTYADGGDDDTAGGDGEGDPIWCGDHAGHMWGGEFSEEHLQWHNEEHNGEGFHAGMMGYFEDGEIPEECLELHGEAGFHGGMMGHFGGGHGPGMMGGWRTSGE